MVVILSMISLHCDLGDDHLILKGGGGLHFLEINILTLKMLEINNLSSIIIWPYLEEKVQMFPKYSARFARNSSVLFFPARFARTK